MSDGGKGSKARPFTVPKEVFDQNWDKIFGNKKTKDHKRPVDKKPKTK
jgi:hypothetical protein